MYGRGACADYTLKSAALLKTNPTEWPTVRMLTAGCCSWAIANGKPFVVLPCCVFAAETPGPQFLLAIIHVATVDHHQC